MEDHMHQFAYETLRAFALTHNYNQWIYEAFEPYLGKTVMEIGCGIGNMSRLFLRSCEKLIGIDTSDIFIKHLKIDYPELELYNYDIAGSEVLELKDKNIDTVVCINVLEHVEDDTRALENVHRILGRNGHFLIFVPALKGLYGTIDKNVSHYRRYDKNALKGKLESVGFVIEKIYYSNLIGVFGWFLNGKILKRKTFPILQPMVFDKLVPLISKLEKFIDLPFGMNLIVVATKR